MSESSSAPKNFIRELITEHVAQGTHGGRVVTRFPPEPNGYLHLGHAKSICLNFGLAREFGGACHLRMDDTNPTTEDPEYVASIQADVSWLGFEWTGETRYASDYFEELYLIAEALIRSGKAYVCSQSEAEMREYRGGIAAPGRPSPYRERSVDESLDLFRRMRAGEFADGAHTLRGRIDMAAENLKLRDPPLWRIRRAHHYRTGDAWCLYPLYDYAHCLSDWLEDVTHSICTLEFENNRALYDWALEALEAVPASDPLWPALAATKTRAGRKSHARPRQYEFARLAVTYTVLSKRKLLELVQSGVVEGWDDPRMPTLSGLRRRGFTAEGLRSFCETIGVAKHNSTVEVELLESCQRDVLNALAPRALGVLDPIELELVNVPEDYAYEITAAWFPADHADQGGRSLRLGKRIFVEREDFAEMPAPGWHRLAPGASVRLRHAHVVRCDEVLRDAQGNAKKLRCHAFRDDASAPKVKGTLHWVDAVESVPATVRVYDRLFTVEKPDAEDDWKATLNPRSLGVRQARVEPSLASAAPGAHFQLERLGFFVVDPSSAPGGLVLNRTLPLKDSWAKAQAPQDARAKREVVRELVHSPPAARAAVTLEGEALRISSNHDVAADDARLLGAHPELLALFDGALALGADPKALAKLLVHELRKPGVEALHPARVAELLAVQGELALTAAQLRELAAALLADPNASPRALAEARGFGQPPDTAALDTQISAVLAAEAQLVGRFRQGEQKLFGAILGAVMRSVGASAPAPLVKERLSALLG